MYMYICYVPLPLLSLSSLSSLPSSSVYKDLYMSLHEGEPCTSCGLRFRDDQRDEYQAHLDWHYHENRLDKDGTRATMRNWFLHPDVSNDNNDNNCAFCDALVYGRWDFLS